MFNALAMGLSNPVAPADTPPLQPASSVFHRSIFVSLLGQTLVHVVTMAYAARMARAHAVPEVCPVETPMINVKYGGRVGSKVRVDIHHGVGVEKGSATRRVQ